MTAITCPAFVRAITNPPIIVYHAIGASGPATCLPPSVEYGLAYFRKLPLSRSAKEGPYFFGFDNIQRHVDHEGSTSHLQKNMKISARTRNIWGSSGSVELAAARSMYICERVRNKNIEKKETDVAAAKKDVCFTCCTSGDLSGTSKIL